MNDTLTIKTVHFLWLAICLMLGAYAVATQGSPFGLFAVVFAPSVYVLLLVGLVLDWFDFSWL